MKRIDQLLTKRIILTFLFAHFLGLASYAFTYYVSNSGNDSNNGLSEDQPWRTIEKVNSTTLIAGDKILFKSGDTFYGSLVIKYSGAEGNPIVYGAYGTGEKPVITGFTEVTEWVDLGNNIWESANAVSTLETCNMVVVDGQNTAMGRYPNADAPNGGYLTYQSHEGKTSITSDALNNDIDWTGAEAVIRVNNWIIDRIKIISQSNNSINFGDSTRYNLADGFGFFIQGDSRVLDIQNEWFFNPISKKIQLYSLNRPADVKVASKNNLALINSNNVLVQNLIFSGANEFSFSGEKKGMTLRNVSINNCSFLFSGISAIGQLKIDNFLIERNMIIDSNTSAIEARYGNGIVIRDNVVKNIGLLIGMGNQVNSAISIAYSTNIEVEYNNVSCVAFNGISFYCNSILIKNNFIEKFCSILDDGGGIYTYVGKNRSANEDVTIMGNVIVNSIGAPEGTDGKFHTVASGIYLDSSSKNVNVIENTIANCKNPGIFINENLGNHVIKNNTVFDCMNEQLRIQNWIYKEGESPNITFSGNILVAKNASQYIAKYTAGTNNLHLLGAFDNNYYARPISNANIFFLSQPSLYGSSNGIPRANKSLVEWQTFSGQDANSKGSPISIDNEDDLRFEYNATKEPKTIKLDEPMMDVKGVKYSGSLILKPFTSIVLIKDPNAKSVKEDDKKTEGAAVPSHFVPVGQSSVGGQEPMTIRVGSAISEDSSLQVGDEIAVFSGSNCVGAVKIVQPIKADNEASYPLLSVYQKSETSNGFVSNDTIVFKLWKQQNQSEINVNKVIYKTNANEWLANGKFVAGSTSVVELISYQELTQTIHLLKGYNLVSTYVVPSDANVSNVLKSITLSGDLSRVQDETGRSFEYWGTALGWTNTLGNMEETEGYKMKVESNCILKVTGKPIAMPFDIPLKEGWNIISYPRVDEVNGMSIFQSLIEQKKLVKVQDENGLAIEDWGSFGGWVNGIGNFVAGKAYKVKVNADAVLSFQESYPKAATIVNRSEMSEYFLSVAEGNGFEHMNINLSGLKESGLSVGDELAAFDGAYCVGAIKISESNLREGMVVITASRLTDQRSKDGFQEGNPIQICIWKQQSGKELVPSMDVLNGKMFYEKNASVFVKFKSQATSSNSWKDQLKMDVFPNPSKGQVSVRFSELPDEGSRIEILDISGRKVASRLISQDTEDFNLEGKTPGFYIVKYTFGKNETTKKLILN